MYTPKTNVGSSASRSIPTVPPTLLHSYTNRRKDLNQSFKKLSEDNGETLQTVSALTDRVMTRPCVMDMWHGGSGPQGLGLLGCGLAIMVWLITCIATQQVISQAETEGLTCHQEINNPSTHSGHHKKRTKVRLVKTFGNVPMRADE